MKARFFIRLFLALSVVALVAFQISKRSAYDNILDYRVDAKSQDIAFYWKDSNGAVIQSIQNLKNYVTTQNKELVFAMNGGMYDANQSPQGLFIQDFRTVTSLDTLSGKGNFYMKPNGVFYITANNMPVVCKTENFVNDGKIKFATQSGPMLLIAGEIHPSFKKGSINLNIRNGVGILPDGKVVFAMSKTEINFYDFAEYFKAQGCKDALYFDGYVSRTYLPEKKWVQMDGKFGVIIGVTKPKKRN